MFNLGTGGLPGGGRVGGGSGEGGLGGTGSGSNSCMFNIRWYFHESDSSKVQVLLEHTVSNSNTHNSKSTSKAYLCKQLYWPNYISFHFMC